MQDVKTKTAYFARPITHYPYELKGRAVLHAVRRHPQFPSAGEILDPNNRMLQLGYQGLKKAGRPDLAMGIFTMFAKAADYFILVLFADGAIGAGVYKEAQAYFNSKSPDDALAFVVKTANGGFDVRAIGSLNLIPEEKVLTVEATRDRIRNGVV